MTAHEHREIVVGCYRCELNADELDPRFDVNHEENAPSLREQTEGKPTSKELAMTETTGTLIHEFGSTT